MCNIATQGLPTRMYTRSTTPYTVQLSPPGAQPTGGSSYYLGAGSLKNEFWGFGGILEYVQWILKIVIGD